MTACQQTLALGVILAVLAPVANVVDLDVVREGPPASAGLAAPLTAPLASRAAGADRSPRAAVPTAPVDAELDEYQLTAPENARVRPGALRARTSTESSGAAEVVSEPVPVTGYGTVGVTWDDDVALADDEVGVQVRMRQDGSWSSWTSVAYEAEHGPDPASAEAGAARPGTDALLVGDVEKVQVRVETDESAPADLRLAVIEPGQAEDTVRERPAVSGTAPAEPTAPTGSTEPADGEALALQAAATEPAQPDIFTRSQWGADERLRDPGSLHYGTVSAGFVHHTVTANGYSKADVPGIMRSIYAYHTQSRGWSDIGYNYLVDRFGRIWEGRYGGIARNPVGAHTLGYNDYAFAMSAIGNFDVTSAPTAMVEAYGDLFAWKLALNDVDASSMRQRVGSSYLPAINGHRDAGSTACPGQYLYAQLSTIRRLAGEAQQATAAPSLGVRDLDSDLTGDGRPDLVVRRRDDARGVIVPTGGLLTLRQAQRVPGSWASWTTIAASPDLTGDGVGDLMTRSEDGTTAVAAGDGAGGFATPVRAPGGPTEAHDLVTTAGDVDEDGRADLVGRVAGTSRLAVFLGNGRGGFTTEVLGIGWARHDRLIGVGDLTGDGDPDLLTRQDDGTLSLREGAGGPRFRKPASVPGSWAKYEEIGAVGDLTGDGLPDLVVRRPGQGGLVLGSRGGTSFNPGYGPLRRLRNGTDVTGGIQVGAGPAVDLLVRRDDRLLWMPNKGTVATQPALETDLDLTKVGVLLNVGDWDGDGDGDVITRRKGALYLHRGDGTGARFAAPAKLARGFLKVRGLAPAGDVTGDGLADLTGTDKDGVDRVYPGRGTRGFGPSYAVTLDEDPRARTDLSDYTWRVEIEDLRSKGRPDLVVKDRDGRLWLLPVTKDGVGQRRFLTDGMEIYDKAG